MSRPEPGGEALLYAAMPGAFVLIWSGGFIAAKVGLGYADPLVFLTLRFGLAAALLVGVAAATGAPWPRGGAMLAHVAVSGVLIQAFYFGGVWTSLKAGVGVGAAALITGMQPVLTAVAAGPLLGERVSPRQWVGFGLGVVGIALVVERKLALGLGTGAGMALSFLALFGITAGTLYQKRFCPAIDPRSGGALQVIAAGIAVAVPAALLEGGAIDWQMPFMAALGYMVLGPSLVALSLLTLMIRRNQAARVGSMFFLVPPVAAGIAHFWLGEPVGAVTLAGMAVAVAGVALVMAPTGRR